VNGKVNIRRICRKCKREVWTDAEMYYQPSKQSYIYCRECGKSIYGDDE
jgi:RNase P subunit RPR2